jgi:hypothetical protein
MEQERRDERERAESNNGGYGIVADRTPRDLGLMGDRAARVVRAVERLASNRLELMKDVAGKVTRRLCRVLHARLRISAELPGKFGDVMRQARDLVARSCP